MLTGDELTQLCERLGLSEEAIAVIKNVRNYSGRLK